ncbi:uncharacterized protein PGTG_18859 [Puccinia graminis f. sp. tritici CRL 75-36-700-3]|uniref:Uncharacterized protein n=1 Tax=Puccinia graminis f. sp. tritici (strain CRL 75-36-700-3 / race SCCL) TaxID=418459 RepID=E3L8Z3_PUCGT|nr:uncharacterized protein PGTG_18859 [Puccinia graminis f. sp. tritici CRL 75-36-700-3]EFP93018.2 hypothetical protein PGTG_18859 [Puccinia graminis f. sp. tritici CRL 75-36-700-3]
MFLRGAGFVILLRIMLILLMIHLIIPSARPANVVGPQQCTNGFALASYHSDSVSCKTSQNVIYDCKVSKCFATSDTSQHGKPYSEFVFEKCHRIDASDHPTKSTSTIHPAEFYPTYNEKNWLEIHGSPPLQPGRRRYQCFTSEAQKLNTNRPWCVGCSLPPT